MRVKQIAVESVTSSVIFNVSRGGTLFESQRELTELVESLASDGWWGDRPIEIIPIGNLDSDLAAKIIAERENGIIPFNVPEKMTIGNVEIKGVEIKRAFSILAEKPVKYVANDGGRRLAALMIANLIREEQGEEKITTIPCYLAEYENDLDRQAANFRRNAEAGRKPVKLTGALAKLVKEMKDKGYLIPDIGRRLGLKRGMLQVCDYLTELMNIKRFENLPDRLDRKEISPRNTLSKHVNGQRAVLKGDVVIKTSPEEVEAALQGESQGAKAMAKASLTAIAEGLNPNSPIKAIIKFILADDKEGFADWRSVFEKTLTDAYQHRIRELRAEKPKGVKNIKV